MKGGRAQRPSKATESSRTGEHPRKGAFERARAHSVDLANDSVPGHRAGSDVFSDDNPFEGMG